jgi:hypothetical protein
VAKSESGLPSSTPQISEKTGRKPKFPLDTGGSNADITHATVTPPRKQ